jgi:hypothetical protein
MPWAPRILKSKEKLQGLNPVQEDSPHQSSAEVPIQPKIPPKDGMLHYILRFSRSEENNTPIDKSFVSYEFYRSLALANLKPQNPPLISARPSGHIDFAVPEATAREFSLLFPDGIQVLNSMGIPTTLLITYHRAASPTAAKAAIPEHIIQKIGVTILHPQLSRVRHLLLPPSSIAAAWQALGFDTHRPHYQANQVQNSQGEQRNAGQTSLFFITLIPPPGISIFGAEYPKVLRVRLDEPTPQGGTATPKLPEDKAENSLR